MLRRVGAFPYIPARCDFAASARNAVSLAALLAVSATAVAQTTGSPDVERSAILAEIGMPLSRGSRELDDAAYEAANRAEAKRIADLIVRIERFVERHPGDSHRDRFETSKLQLVFVQTTMLGLPFDRLRSETARIDAAAPVGALRAASAYWRLRVDQIGSAARTLLAARDSAEPTAALSGRDAADHARAFAADRRSVRIAVRLARDAIARGEIESAEQWLYLLKTHHPRHVSTADVAARLNRARAMGRTWGPVLHDLSGNLIDWDARHGRIVAVVFWKPSHRPAGRVLRQLRQRAAELDVVLIAVDKDADAVRRAVGEFAPPLPCVCDGLGWESPVVAELGVRNLPTVLILDRAGRLVEWLTPEAEPVSGLLDSALERVLQAGG